MGFNVADKSLTVSVALPAAGATAVTAGIDLGLKAGRDFLPDMEFEVSVPATPDLVEAKTIIIDIETDDDVAFGSPKKICDNLITVTGAALAAGGVAASERFRVPTNVERYIRATATVLAAGGSNIAVSMTLKPLF
jgi:hypothetical protein